MEWAARWCPQTIVSEDSAIPCPLHRLIGLSHQAQATRVTHATRPLLKIHVTPFRLAASDADVLDVLIAIREICSQIGMSQIVCVLSIVC